MKLMDFLPEGDPRAEEWPLMSDPLPTLLTVVVYLAVVVGWGQRYMSLLPSGLSVNRIMVFYNLCMVLFSCWMCFEFCAAGWFSGGYTLGCQLVDQSRRPKALRMVRVCWFFYISKIIELFDTVFFVIRRKFDQVSFLHVYHHAVMPISWWFAVKYVPGGISTFHALLNSFVHIMMYTYYGLAAAGPQYRRFTWWKKYMTTAQILQFLLICFHSVYTLSLRDCPYSKNFIYWILFNSLVFLVLFANFYAQSYNKRSLAKCIKCHELVSVGSATTRQKRD